MNFAQIAEWLGHQDGGVLVAKTYGHLRTEFSQEMAKRMTYYAGMNEEPSVETIKNEIKIS